jgi:sortase B
MSKKKLLHLLLILFLLLMAFPAFKVISILYQSYTNQQKFSQLSNQYYQASTPDATVPDEESGRAGTTAFLSQFYSLIAQNRDIGGWIRIEGTAVDYPVMYTPEKPQKYLHMAFDGTYSIYGVPFIGDGCSLSPRSDNVVIYGHNMKDGSMFATLVNYQKKRYWEEHPIVEFSTQYESHRYQIFAAFSTDLESAKTIRCYSFINAVSERDFDRFIDGIREVALYDTGVNVSYGDRFLTLSTCAYHKKNGRFVLIARELSD